MKFNSIIFGFLIILSLNSFAVIKTELIEYNDGPTVLEGYLAYDDSHQGLRPAIVVVHEWMGINDYTKMRCQKLAELGYVAFAADIYGKGVRPKNGQEASKQAGMYKENISLLRSRINAAIITINNFKFTDKKRIAAIGYCFGGTTVLELARSGAEIKGVVSFHGGLGTRNPEDAKNIKCKILILHGAEDPFVKEEEVSAFEKEMRSAKTDFQLIKYSGAVHAFTNPASGKDNTRGAAYNEVADKRSWEAMKQFFKELFE